MTSLNAGIYQFTWGTLKVYPYPPTIRRTEIGALVVLFIPPIPYHVYQGYANYGYCHMHTSVTDSTVRLDLDANSCAVIHFVLIDSWKHWHNGCT